MVKIYTLILTFTCAIGLNIISSATQRPMGMDWHLVNLPEKPQQRHARPCAWAWEPSKMQRFQH
jgi:hypothetical protein